MTDSNPPTDLHHLTGPDPAFLSDAELSKARELLSALMNMAGEAAEDSPDGSVRRRAAMFVNAAVGTLVDMVSGEQTLRLEARLSDPEDP